MSYNFYNGQQVNGKRVSLPSTDTATEIVAATGREVDMASRAVFRTTAKGNERLVPGKTYDVKPGDKFQVGPDRVKGSGESYFCGKEEWRKRVIVDQVADLAAKLFNKGVVRLDDDCNWVLFENFRLP